MQRMQLNVVVGLLGIVASTIGSLGCSRVERGSQLIIEIPSSISAPESARHYKMGSGWTLQASEAPRAQSTLPIKFVAVNISGSDIKGRLYKVWESNAGSTNPVVSFDAVPKGTNRLVQVIAAAEGSEGIVIYYGDSIIQVDRDVIDTPPIQLAHIGDSAQGDADIAGRLLRADGTGPTGTLNVMFKPPSDRPQMILFRLDIIAGWFESMLATSNSFSYLIEETGEGLWSGITKDSEAFYSATQPGRNMKVQIPAAYRPNWDNPTGPRERMEKRTVIVGYFGDPAGTDGKKVCYSKATEDLEDVYTADSPSTTKMQWKDAPNLTTQAGVTRGGLDQTGTICTSKTDYVDRLVFDHQQIRNRDNVLGFSGPFRRITATDPNLFSSSWAAEQLTINWKYLPGVVSQAAIGGVEIFRRSRNSNDDRDLYGGPGGIQCGKLSALGFTRLGSVSIPTESYVVSGVSNADFSNRNIQIVLCPYRDSSTGRRFLNSGALVRMDFGGGNGGGGGGNGPSPATQLVAFAINDQLTTTAAKALVPIDASYPSCYPMRIEARDNAGNRGGINPGTNLIVSSTNGNDQFYEHPSCNTTSANPLVTNFWGERTIYVKSSRGSAGTEAILIRTEQGTVTQLTTQFHADFQFMAAAANTFVTIAPSSIIAHKCYPVSYLSRYGSTPAPITSFSTVTYPTTSGLQYYTDAYCGYVDAPTFQFQASDISAYKGFIYSGTLSSISLQPSSISAGSGSPLTIPTALASVTQPGALSRIAMWTRNDMSAETCERVTIQLVDANHNPTPVTSTMLSSGSNLVLTLNKSGGDFYNEMTCSSPNQVTSATIPVNSTTTGIWYKATAGGSFTISASTSNRAAGVMTSETQVINAGPAVANRVMMVLPGQQISSGTMITGTAWPIFRGFPVGISLHAITPNGNLDTAFNHNSSAIGLSISSGTTSGYLIVNEPSWSGGVATGAGAAWLRWDSGTPGGLATGNGGSLNLQYVGAYPPFFSPFALSFLSTSQFSNGNCQPFLVQASATNYATATPLVTAATISAFSDANSMISGIFGNPDCTTGVTAILANHSATIVYGSVVSSGATPAITATTPQTAAFDPPSMSPVLAAAAGAATQWALLGKTSFNVGACQPLAVILKDANGNGVSPAAVATATLTSSDGLAKFYTDGTCSAGGVTSAPLSFTTSDRAKLIYYRGIQSGAATLTVTDGGTGYTNGTHAISTY